MCCLCSNVRSSTRTLSLDRSELIATGQFRNERIKTLPFFSNAELPANSSKRIFEDYSGNGTSFILARTIQEIKRMDEEIVKSIRSCLVRDR